MAHTIFIPFDIASNLNQWIDDLVSSHGEFFHGISNAILKGLLAPIEHFLLGIHPLWLIGIVGLLSYIGTRKVTVSTLFMIGIYFIGCMGLWERSIQTISIMGSSLILTVLLGIPVGVLMASSNFMSKIITPILDVMQTFPLFVYMLPAVMLFSIGKVPAVIATIIYALPPLIRLTELGIRQIDAEVSEAGHAFGSNRLQTLAWISLPLARASIMAGINQATMMALAMTVVASMIGANGLGEDILGGLTNLDFGKGASAGVAVVILAIVIDRITQSYGTTSRHRSSLKKFSVGEKNDSYS